MTPHVALMLKAPRAGRVKTRLALAVGDAVALRLYRHMAEHALEVCRAAGWTRTVWFDPPDAEQEMRAWLGNVPLAPQPEGNLGRRMAHAAAAAEAEAVEAVVFLGGDCPGLGAPHLEQAAAALREAPLVLGPSPDGGYYLLGIRLPAPDVFTGMPWSTDGVLEATRARLRSLGLMWRELPPLRDVDTLDDAIAEGLVRPAGSEARPS